MTSIAWADLTPAQAAPLLHRALADLGNVDDLATRHAAAQVNSLPQWPSCKLGCPPHTHIVAMLECHFHTLYLSEGFGFLVLYAWTTSLCCVLGQVSYVIHCNPADARYVQALAHFVEAAATIGGQDDKTLLEPAAIATDLHVSRALPGPATHADLLQRVMLPACKRALSASSLAVHQVCRALPS